MMPTGGTIPLQCKICCKTFSGPVSAQQHFASMEHNKKQFNARSAHSGYYCSVCNVSCDTQAVLQAHCQSPRHQAMEGKQKTMPGHTSQPSRPVGSSPRTAQMGTQFGTSQEVPAEQEYVFSSQSQKGFCYLCNIELTSRSHAQGHISGKNHKKKSMLLERNLEKSNTDENWYVDPMHIMIALKPSADKLQSAAAVASAYTAYSCSICCMRFNSEITKSAHLESDKHKKKVQMLAERRTESSMLSCDVCEVTFTGQQNKEDHYASYKHKKKVQSLTETQGDSSSLFCDICGVTFTGQQCKDSHMLGEKHKKKIKALEDQQVGESSSLVCNACGVYFTGKQNMEDHFKGKKHLRNVQNTNIRQTLVSSSPTSNSSSSPNEIQRLTKARKDEASTGLGYGFIAHPRAQYPDEQFRYSIQAETTTKPVENHNLYTAYGNDKFASYRDEGGGNDNESNDEDFIAKPIENDGSAVMTSGSRLQFNLSNTDRNVTTMSSNASTLSSLDIKPDPVIASSAAADRERVDSGETDEDKIKAETHPDLDSLTDTMSTLDIKSEFTETNTESLSSSRLTDVIKFYANDIPGAPLPHGRGRGIFLLGKYLPTLPMKKVMNTDRKITEHAEETMPNALVQETLNNQDRFADDESETVRKTTWHGNISGENPTPSESSTEASNTQTDREKVDEGLNVENDDVDLNWDELKSESEDSLAQEGIHFERNVNHDYDRSKLDLRPIEERLQTIYPIGWTNEPDHFFDPQTGTGRCFVCEIDFTSRMHKDQHLAGKRHLKTKVLRGKMKACNLTQDNSLVCDVCTVSFSCVSAKEQHFSSERHLQKLKIQQGLVNVETYFCEICNIPCSSQGNYEQHLRGAQHRKMTSSPGSAVPVQPNRNMAGSTESPVLIQPAMLQGTDRTQWYPCTICNCQLNSYEQLQIHLKSPKHLVKLEQTKMGGDQFDQTNWYPCNVCKCQMNTLEQLQIHEKSPKHLKQLQKAGIIRPPEQTFSHTQMTYQSYDGFKSEQNTHHSNKDVLQTPLDSFLSQELFPEEFLPNDVKLEHPKPSADKHYNERAANHAPSPVELNVTDGAFILPERYAAFNPAKISPLDDSYGDTNPGCYGNDLGSRAKGHMSDLAFATRSRSNGVTGKDMNKAEDVKANAALSSTLLGAKPKEPVGGNVNNQYADQTNNPTVNNPYAATHSYYCHTCKSPMNTRESYENHLKGKRHLQKVCVEPAPIREHLSALDIPPEYMPYTSTKPRNYQFELYEKSMQDNSLVFLPTGTGKTMVSVMTMSALLEKYPTKNVLFLVDKVLLVFQQSKYITAELGDKTFVRFNGDSVQCTDVERRPVRIAALCMGQQTTGGVPLWKHDIVVVTAGFCQSLLEKNIVRWQDFSLVVFDEAHHCEKGHPFNFLLYNYHLKLSQSCEKPRILGLTASPAGKDDVPKTVQMLETLTSNMGGVRMRINEKSECVATLNEYQSNAQMIIKSVMDKVDNSENVFGKTFREELNIYIMSCVLRLLQISNIKNYLNLDKQIKPGMSETVVRMLANNFVECELDMIQSSLMMIESKEASDKVQFSYFQTHVQEICMARSSLMDGGIVCALQDLDEMEKTEWGFRFAKPLGMQTDLLQHMLKTDRAVFLRAPPTEGDSDAAPADHHVRHLIEELTNLCNGRVSDDTRRISLVLVKQRSTAHHLSTLLQHSPRMQQTGLQTTTVVGHGGSGVSAGMSVKQQKRTLEEIKQYKYQVIIATSVAEEGVDWPECERVISMYPPSTVTALIQMRGRARRKDSKFIVLCGSMEEEEKLRDIMKREQNMIIATKQLVNRE